MKKQEDSDHFRKVTECYYSRILGTSDNLFAHNYLKPFFFYTPIRNAPLQGYEHRFDLLAIQTEQGIIISYGDAVLTEIPKLEMALESDTVSLHEAISRILKKEPRHSYKYYFSGRIPKGFSARPLNASDYEELLNLLDLSLYMQCCVEERFARRLKRNMQYGQKFEDIANYYLQTVRISETEIIEPTAVNADIWINSKKTGKSLALIVDYCKRTIQV